MNLQNRLAVVTGGAQGIGRAICLSLVKRGAMVISLDVQDDLNLETENLMNEIKDGNHALHCDISNPQMVNIVFDEIEKTYGFISVLINNAAVFSTMSYVKDSFENALSDWAFNMDTNARGTYLCSKKVAPAMASHREGQILNIVTNHVKRYLYPPSDSEHSYDASKFAQLALNEGLACELKNYGIRVNALCPAATRSPMLEDFFKSIHMELTKENLGVCSGIASLLEAEEVAETACEMLLWDDTQPSGNAYLLVYSEDCEALKKGHVERLAK